jgi:hypothetical protein
MDRGQLWIDLHDVHGYRGLRRMFSVQPVPEGNRSQGYGEKGQSPGAVGVAMIKYVF